MQGEAMERLFGKTYTASLQKRLPRFSLDFLSFVELEEQVV